MHTYRPHTSSESHWIWHTTGNRGAEGEIIISYFPCAVSAQWTVIGVSIIWCRCSSQTEDELIVTLSTAEEPNIAAVIVPVSMATVLICVRPHLQYIVGLDELHQKKKKDSRSRVKLHDRLLVVILWLQWPVRSAAIQGRSSLPRRARCCCAPSLDGMGGARSLRPPTQPTHGHIEARVVNHWVNQLWYYYYYYYCCCCYCFTTELTVCYKETVTAWQN